MYAGHACGAVCCVKRIAGDRGQFGVSAGTINKSSAHRTYAHTHTDDPHITACVNARERALFRVAPSAHHYHAGHWPSLTGREGWLAVFGGAGGGGPCATCVCVRTLQRRPLGPLRLLVAVSQSASPENCRKSPSIITCTPPNSHTLTHMLLYTQTRRRVCVCLYAMHSFGGYAHASAWSLGRDDDEDEWPGWGGRRSELHRASRA